MKNRKAFFGGIIILVLIGVVLFYFAIYRQPKKIETRPSENEHSDNDSATHSNHEVTPGKLGTKPQRNPKDGSIQIVEDYVKSNAKNPDTFEFLEWSELSPENGYWKVRCKYRGISSFNAEVTTNAWFYIRNNKVMYSKTISKI